MTTPVALLPHRVPSSLALPAIPVPQTSFVGRESELAMTEALLRRDTVRIVTLIGPGGIGKTRLALQTVMRLGDSIAEDIHFVDLSHLRDPDLVLPTITRALDLQAEGRSITNTLNRPLHGQGLLVVLDNFEQVLTAALPLAGMVEKIPNLRVLITSRSPLRLSGEHIVEVAPLPLPRAHARVTANGLADYDIIRLYTDRVRAVQPGFTITDDNAQAVVDVCRRLDGLPLAIELAAGWSPVLSPQALLARLGNSLPMLDDGPRDLPARHRTMRGAIAWSYDLLDDREQAVLRKISVFTGVFTVEGEVAVCAAGPGSDINILRSLGALVTNSLLHQEPQIDGEPRFTLLETVREYGLERLADHDEVQFIRRRHAEYVLAFAEQAEPALIRPDQEVWLDRLDIEQGNLRDALAWMIDQHEERLALRLAGSLGTYWRLRFHVGEGRDWFDRVLALNDDAHAAPLGKALLGAGTLAWVQGDYGQAHALLDGALARLKGTNETNLFGRTLLALGRLAWDQDETDLARTRFEEAHRLFQDDVNRFGMANCLHGLGLVAQSEGTFQQATALFEEALNLWRTLGLSWGLACCIPGHLGDVARAQGQFERANGFYREGLVLNEQH